jgi:hypothetical protein
MIKHAVAASTNEIAEVLAFYLEAAERADAMGPGYETAQRAAEGEAVTSEVATPVSEG